MCGRVVRVPGLIRRSVALTTVLSFVLLATPLGAQSPQFTQAERITTGRVMDESGGALPGATVTFQNGGDERRVVTDAAGYFEFLHLAPGPATVSVEFPQFAGRTVRLSSPRRDLRVVLAPIPVVEAVTVVAADRRPVSAGTRTGTPARDVPQSTTVISSDLIADQMMKGMADVVNYVPGVGMAQGEGHRDAPIFRGNTSTADFLVDGLRDDTQYLRDLYNVERVEVLKGPNGMMFGRGGVAGVINRVTRHADWTAPRELAIQTGSWGQRRLSADLGQAVGRFASARVTGMYENSDTHRDNVSLERYGFNPTFAVALGRNTSLKAGYELFHDARTTDRGVPSFDGRPLDVAPSTFFGHADVNESRVTVNAFSAALEHKLSDHVMFRNRARFADYDKSYENLLPGSVNASLTTVALSGYRSVTTRQNLFNQADLVVTHRTGRVGHTVLAGVELGRQVTDNERTTAYFPALGTTSITVPLGRPTTTQPVEFRSSATDARNHGVAAMAALYVQDEIALTSRLKTIVGLRFDAFDVELLDHRTQTTLTSEDGLLSPRVALIYKPIEPMSIYGSYTRASLPRAGEQLASLTLTTQAIAPEEFSNYEAGAKWDLTHALAFSTAVYRLTRSNVVVAAPNDPTRSLLVDGARTNGLEIELAGRLSDRWSVQGGYAFQDAKVLHTLSSTMPAGAALGQVPRHTFSLWNKYDVSRALGVGLGIISRDDSFVATDNRVVLPGFTRVDAGLFYTFSQKVRAHVNVENLFDTRYYWAAHSNNNIAPGSPRAIRFALRTTF